MSNRIDTHYVTETARAAAAEVASEVNEVHGPLWEARENLSKLLVSLSSGILVGTITFSGELMGVGNAAPVCSALVVVSWSMLFFSLISAILSLWFSTTFKSFMVRFTNAEPALLASLRHVDASMPVEELKEHLVDEIAKMARAASQPLGYADTGARISLIASLFLFSAGVGVFLWFGALQVTSS